MKVVNTSGKRKNAVARATAKAGVGNVRINGVLISNYEPKLSRLKIREPLLIAGDAVNKLNISVNVHGGGVTSQADAARLDPVSLDILLSISWRRNFRSIKPYISTNYVRSTYFGESVNGHKKKY